MAKKISPLSKLYGTFGGVTLNKTFNRHYVYTSANAHYYYVCIIKRIMVTCN